MIGMLIHPTPPTNVYNVCITQQSNMVGVRFMLEEYWVEEFIRGIKPDFHYFGASKMM